MTGSRDFVRDHPNGDMLGLQLDTANWNIHKQKAITEAARLAVIESTGEERLDAADESLVESFEREKDFLYLLRHHRNYLRNELGMNRRSQGFIVPPGPKILP